VVSNERKKTGKYTSTFLSSAIYHHVEKFYEMRNHTSAIFAALLRKNTLLEKMTGGIEMTFDVQRERCRAKSSTGCQSCMKLGPPPAVGGMAGGVGWAGSLVRPSKKKFFEHAKQK
jgi:hypothetical protein